MAKHSRQKNRKASVARLKMAQHSLTHRVKILEELIQQNTLGDRTTAATKVRNAVWIAVQVASNGITIWQAVDENVKLAIKSALSSISIGFMMRLESVCTEEQVVQAGKLITVLRIMNKTLGEIKMPVLNNSFSEEIFVENLEDAVFAGLAMSEEHLPQLFLSLRSKWEFDSKVPLPPIGPLPDDLAPEELK